MTDRNAAVHFMLGEIQYLVSKRSRFPGVPDERVQAIRKAIAAYHMRAHGRTFGIRGGLK